MYTITYMKSKYQALYDAALLWLHCIEYVCDSDCYDVRLKGAMIDKPSYIGIYYVLSPHNMYENNDPLPLTKCMDCLGVVLVYT